MARSAYRVLASLEYPIADRAALRARLERSGPPEQRGQDPEPAEAAELILRTLRAEDFGLDSARGALEKFAARLGLGAAGLPWEGPLGPELVPGPDPREEWPEPVPDEPFFGTDTCGRAAARLYQERVDRDARRFGGARASRAAYYEATDFAARCRVRLPRFGGPCAASAARAWADCYANGLPSSGCDEVARLVQRLCERVRGPRPWPRFAGRRPPWGDA